jgi:predicted  nucleic acid-binding Zn-ribbon protein
VASEAREDRRSFNDALEDLDHDVAGIKESLEEKASEARDERRDLSSMLEELLSEIRQE